MSGTNGRCWAGLTLSSTLLVILGWQVEAHGDVPAFCDQNAYQNRRGVDRNLLYEKRDDRCEGFFAASYASALELNGFAAFCGDRSASTQWPAQVVVRWRVAAEDRQRTLHLRAMNISGSRHYLMEVDVPANAGQYQWPTAILADGRVKRDELAVLATLRDAPDSPYVPVQLHFGSDITSCTSPYTAIVTAPFVMTGLTVALTESQPPRESHVPSEAAIVRGTPLLVDIPNFHSSATLTISARANNRPYPMSVKLKTCNKGETGCPAAR